MERASERARFNQAGCGHSTASASAFVLEAESRQAPSGGQKHSGTTATEFNEVIGFI